MVDISLEIPINTDAVEALIARFERASSYFDAAPDDDPFKVAMAAFGEIDCDRDIQTKVDFHDGQVVVTVTPVPELQRIMDMVPD